MEVLKIRNQVTGEWEEITAIKGADGKTPIKGVDYYTEAEKQELINEINQSSVDLSDYYTKEETDALIPDTSLFVTGEYVQTAINQSLPNMSEYAKKTDIPNVSSFVTEAKVNELIAAAIPATVEGVEF